MGQRDLVVHACLLNVFPTKESERIQMNQFCHHEDTICHPNSSYVTTKLYLNAYADETNNSAVMKKLISCSPPSTHAGHLDLAR